MEGLGADPDLTTLFDYDLQTTGTKEAADADGLIAVIRVDSGLEDLDFDPLTSAVDYANFDMLVIANLTELNFGLPRLGVHYAGSIDTDLELALGFDGLFEASPVEVTALNANTVWATLIPEGQATVKFSVDGAVQNVKTNLGVGEVAYVTASRPFASDLGGGGTVSDFAGLSAVTYAANGTNIYALSKDRDALLVIGTEDLQLKQVFEQGFHGVEGLERRKDIVASNDGKHVYVTGTGANVAIFSVDAVSNRLVFQTVQTLDAGMSEVLVPITEFDQSGHRGTGVERYL